MALETEEGAVPAVSLAPMAVLPEYQGREIGSGLVREGIERLRARGERIVLVLGHEHYYPRFGFSAAKAAPLSSPFPPEAYMALELTEGALTNVRGSVRYAARIRTLDRCRRILRLHELAGTFVFQIEVRKMTRTILVLLVCSVLTCAQSAPTSVTGSYKFTTPQTTQSMEEIAKLLRSVASVPQVTIDPSTAALIFTGTAEAVNFAAWILPEIDKTAGASAVHEYRFPSGDIGRVTFLSNPGTPQSTQELMTIVRTVADVGKISTLSTNHAIVMRSHDWGIAFAAWIVGQIDRPRGSKAESDPARIHRRRSGFQGSRTWRSRGRFGKPDIAEANAAGSYRSPRSGRCPEGFRFLVHPDAGIQSRRHRSPASAVAHSTTRLANRPCPWNHHLHGAGRRRRNQGVPPWRYRRELGRVSRHQSPCRFEDETHLLHDRPGKHRRAWHSRPDSRRHGVDDLS